MVSDITCLVAVVLGPATVFFVVRFGRAGEAQRPLFVAFAHPGLALLVQFPEMIVLFFLCWFP